MHLLGQVRSSTPFSIEPNTVAMVCNGLLNGRRWSLQSLSLWWFMVLVCGCGLCSDGGEVVVVVSNNRSVGWVGFAVGVVVALVGSDGVVGLLQVFWIWVLLKDLGFVTVDLAEFCGQWWLWVEIWWCRGGFVGFFFWIWVLLLRWWLWLAEVVVMVDLRLDNG